MASRRRGRQRHQPLPALEPRLVDPPSDNRVGRDDAAPPGEAPEPSHQPPADEPVTQAAIPVSRQQTAGGQQHERGDPDPGGSVLSPGCDVDRRDDPNGSGQCPGVPATAGGRAVRLERARAEAGRQAKHAAGHTLGDRAWRGRRQHRALALGAPADVQAGRNGNAARAASCPQQQRLADLDAPQPADRDRGRAKRKQAAGNPERVRA